MAVSEIITSVIGEGNNLPSSVFSVSSQAALTGHEVIVNHNGNALLVNGKILVTHRTPRPIINHLGQPIQVNGCLVVTYNAQ